MNRFFLLIIATFIAGSAHAKPSYKDARALYDQIKKPVYDTGLFFKKPFQERVAYLKAAVVLRDRAEKMFGVPSQCFNAASMRSEYVSHLHDFANRLEGRISTPMDWMAVTNPMYTAFSYGESTAACYDHVEALETPKRKVAP